MQSHGYLLFIQSEGPQPLNLVRACREVRVWRWSSLDQPERVTLSAGERPTEKLHVFSCYAPTFAACQDLKETFYDDLQSAINELPSSERYVMVILMPVSALARPKMTNGREYRACLVWGKRMMLVETY